MATAANLLLEQLDVHWHSTEWFVSFDAALTGLTAMEASWTTDGAGYTIWQIVNHLVFCNADIVQKVTGKGEPLQAADNDASFGDPGDPSDDEGWSITVRKLHGALHDLQELIASMNDEKLDAPYRENKSITGRLLGNIMMHDTYHLGQIVLMRKLQRSWTPVDWG
ncbi:DinB family protein [Alicyclobacillus sp. ALC3]|uniref:DinB family protein n=1 Tax=Alicyclobacillus sp. ALC3 TaxID=2796143 RepID=UPI002379252B|nr:DinB family protein [Alicyclobacillus sp. ALC3]WDL97531.1 DinB family protein [Alicyclobacillus sp. ALC3]